jgi:hypothetical protein
VIRNASFSCAEIREFLPVVATVDENRAYTNTSTTFGTVLHGGRLELTGAIFARGMLGGAIAGQESSGNGI